MAFIGSGFRDIRGIRSKETLDGVGARAAVIIIVYVSEIGGTGAGIFLIQINISFAKAASEQTAQDFAAGITVQRESTDQFAALCAVYHSLKENRIGLIDPGGAQIVCKADQSIVLTLGELQFILFDKLFIQHRFHTGQVVTQQHFRCFFGDAVLLILLQHIRGALGAVAYGHLTVVLIRILTEAFFTF